MNRIPSDYVSKLNLKETQKAIEFIKNELLNELKEAIEFVLVREPKISTRKLTTNVASINNVRPINFDSSNDNIVYYIFNEYKHWFINNIDKLEVKNNHGIGSFLNFVNRDEEITNTKSMEKNMFQLEYRFDNEKAIFDKARDINTILVNIIKKIEEKLVKRFPVFKAKLPKNINIKDFNRFGNKKDFAGTAAEVGAKERTFILLKRNNKNSYMDGWNFEYSLLGYSKFITEVYPIYTIRDRLTLEDLEPNISDNEFLMEEYIFSKDHLIGKDYRTLNISIDMDALSMMLLQKSHILEIQSGTNLEDIEKILNNSDIKHL